MAEVGSFADPFVEAEGGLGVEDGLGLEEGGEVGGG